MQTEPTPESAPVPQIRRLLHGVNDELSIAILQLDLLLEESTLDARQSASIQEALRACQDAARELRSVWRLLE